MRLPTCGSVAVSLTHSFLPSAVLQGGDTGGDVDLYCSRGRNIEPGAPAEAEIRNCATVQFSSLRAACLPLPVCRTA